MEENPYGMEFEEVLTSSPSANKATIASLQQLLTKKPQLSRSRSGSIGHVVSQPQEQVPASSTIAQQTRKDNQLKKLHLKTIQNFENNIIASLNQISGHLRTILDTNEQYTQRLKNVASETLRLWILSNTLQLTQVQKFRLKQEFRLHLKDHATYLFQTIASLKDQIETELKLLLKKKQSIRFIFLDDTKKTKIENKIKKLMRLLQTIDALNVKLQILNQ